MRWMRHRTLFLILAWGAGLGLTNFASNGNAYSPDTHKEVSETAAGRSIAGDVLKAQYGLNAGLDHTVLNQKISQWIRDGGGLEDDPSIRARNHFHNPLQPWPQSGLTILGIPSGQSSIYWQHWQQNPDQNLGGTWSWPVARSRFFDFLTKPNKTDRDTALADTARALGQIIHMIQDTAPPAHTRNDPNHKT